MNGLHNDLLSFGRSSPKTWGHGFLDLGFKSDLGGSTQLEILGHQWPLRVVRGFSYARHGILIHLHNVAGGVLGGDVLKTDLHLGEGTYVVATTTGAQRLYRAKTPPNEAFQSVHGTLASQARLEYLPDPTIPYRGSLYRQQTRWNLELGAALLTWDIVAAGRCGYEPDFSFNLYGSENSVFVGNNPVYWEHQELTPSATKSTRPFGLGGWNHWGTFLLIDSSQDPKIWLSMEKELVALLVSLNATGRGGDLISENTSLFPKEPRFHGEKLAFGVSVLRGHGICIKILSHASSEILSAFHLARNFLVRKLWKFEPEAIRKVH